MSLKAATLFSGICAPETAMPDWRWIWCAEVAKFPSAVIAQRHSSTVNLGDVTAHDFTDRALAIGRPDVLVFGSPCQSYSVAGKRLGLDDPRGNLALIALGLVSRLRPTWFAFENVPGLFSSWSGGPEGDAGWPTQPDQDGVGTREFTESSDFAAFLCGVSDIRYHGAWTVLDAQFAGLAQRRDRLFFVGHSGDWRRAAAVLFEPESLCGHPPTRGETRQDVTGTLSSRASAGGGLGTDFSLALKGRRNATNVAAPVRDLSAGGGSREATVIAFSAKDSGADSGEISPTLRSGNHDKSHANGGVMPAIAYQCQGSNVGEMGTLRAGNGNETGGVPFVPVAFDWQSGGSKQRTRTRTSALSANQTPAVLSVALRGREGGGMAELGGEQATALRASQGGGDKPHVLTSAVRRLTPRECERLQGFPDDYTLVTYNRKPAKDGPRYQAIGNSMAVPVIRWILERIQFVHAAKEIAHD